MRIRPGPLVLVLIAAAGCRSERGPTEEDFQKVKQGMTRTDVEAILGKGSKSENWLFTKGKVQHTAPDGRALVIGPDDILEWRDRKGGALGSRFFVVMFAGDKVVTKTTYQEGPAP